DSDTVLFGSFHVHFIADALEPAEHHRARGPLPDAQRRFAFPAGDAFEQHLIERQLHVGTLRATADELPVVLVPAAHCSALLTAIAMPAGEKPYSSAPSGTASSRKRVSSCSDASAAAPSRLRFR